MSSKSSTSTSTCLYDEDDRRLERALSRRFHWRSLLCLGAVLLTLGWLVNSASLLMARPLTGGSPRSMPTILSDAKEQVFQSKLRAQELQTITTGDDENNKDNDNEWPDHEVMTPPLGETPSPSPVTHKRVETWPMHDDFYTSRFLSHETSTTIIFNLFQGSAEALAMQLAVATSQQFVTPPEIWVMCFHSPLRAAYERVVNQVRARVPHKIIFTVSEFNHKFHGRFLLAYMATTKYVLIVDDDRMLSPTIVYDYIQCMHRQRGVWGNMGHIRAKDFTGYRAWPKHALKLAPIPKDAFVEVDYLSGMWFLEQSWLEYFVKERPPTWQTAEDMHLSHVMRKYLNLNSYGANVALEVPLLPVKTHRATVGSALELREYVFDHQLGRGNKVVNVEQPIRTLVYIETVSDANDFMRKLASCRGGASTKRAPWCDAGATAAVFRGGPDQDVGALLIAAKRLCKTTNCEYFSVKPKIQHAIQYFDMRESFGQHGIDVPMQTAASDILLSFVGVLNNLEPEYVFLPSVDNQKQQQQQESAEETGSGIKPRWGVYHDTLRLALKIHRNSPSNPKWGDRKRTFNAKTAYPSSVRAFAWTHSAADAYTANAVAPESWRELVTEF